jgi:hypothetical protein
MAVAAAVVVIIIIIIIIVIVIVKRIDCTEEYFEEISTVVLLINYVSVYM